MSAEHFRGLPKGLQKRGWQTEYHKRKIQSDETQIFNSATHLPNTGFWRDLTCFLRLRGNMAITAIHLALWSSDESRQNKGAIRAHLVGDTVVTVEGEEAQRAGWRPGFGSASGVCN